MLKRMQDNSYLFAGNATFIEELYETYLENPGGVTPAWRAYFDRLQQPGAVPDVVHTRIREAFVRLARGHHPPAAVHAAVAEIAAAERKQVHVLQLINAHRFLGVRHANLDPLERQEPPPVPELDPAHYGLTVADLDSVYNTGSFVGPAQATLRDIVAALKRTYCNAVGLEYMHIADVAQKRWIQARFESIRSTPSWSPEEKCHILERLVAGETFEKYLHTRFVGQKRFSLEGSESLIPLLDCLVRHAASLQIQELVIGMAHRGRLNVLVNILGKPPVSLFEEFEGKHKSGDTSGDVKYHQGYSRDVATPSGPIHLTLGFNPSHLEIIGPVIEGATRARQQRRVDKQGRLAVPVLLHGDSAFAGQGVVMETLNLSQTRGYGTGGTVHVVVNNQIGFTTSDPRDTRSTLYCTDVAKMVDAPVFHVNADDPEAVLLVTQAALDFRMQFGKDVVIDLICFRRLGHNEQDEPMVTQPLMYKKIGRHPGTRKLYAERLVREGAIAPSDPEAMVTQYRVMLEGGGSLVKTMPTDYKRSYAVDWKPFVGTTWTQPVTTGIPEVMLNTLVERLTTVPAHFKLHPTVEKIIAARRAMGQGTLPLDWGMAENLAYAALLQDGYGVRLSGQDTGRGTFFHRHAVLHDQNRERWDEGVYVPLQNIKERQPNFVVIDSILSEEAVLAFEYGYAAAEPNELVVWEAQFGDFANGAQVVIDQFIAASESKWGVLCGLAMMLPHGYEGQGPEHSSARLNRYLQLCAEYNLQVCVPTLPAQMFHLLRRQMLRPYRKPLVIMSPKSMLRHKESVSPLKEITNGEFHPVIGDVEKLDPARVRRVIACSGKVYFDLARARRERKIGDIAILRIEQLYPFPHADFKRELQRYVNATELLWAQEEPRNQGAWYWVQHYLRGYLAPGQTLASSARPSSASPAVGYLDVHNAQQQALVDEALKPGHDLGKKTEEIAGFL
jgi:2-oxoglutarate dehydrogenase E1 component